nr:unnamed protein product [Spirometra erinaceieuropaei]
MVNEKSGFSVKEGRHLDLPAAYKVLRHHNRRAQDQTTTPGLRRPYGDSPTASLLGEEEEEPPDRPPDTGAVTSPPGGMVTHNARGQNTSQPSPDRPRQREERERKKIDQQEAVQRDTPLVISGGLSAFYALTMESRPSSSKRQHPNKPVPVSSIVLPVAATGRSKRELSFEESQPSTIGEANQRRRGRKTGSTCGRYRPVKEGAVD